MSRRWKCSVLQLLRNYHSLSSEHVDDVINSCVRGPCMQLAFCVHTACTCAPLLHCSGSFSQSSQSSPCSSVVGLFDVCWRPSRRDLPSSSCSIWSVGVCDDSRGTIVDDADERLFSKVRYTVHTTSSMNCCHPHLTPNTTSGNGVTT